MTKGIGEDLDRDLNAAMTVDDYQRVLTDIQNGLFHLHMLEEDANDKTPYTQAHTTDLKLLDYYGLLGPPEKFTTLSSQSCPEVG